MRALVGGYSADMDGAASGIATLLAGEADAPSAAGTLHLHDAVTSASSPSWVSVDRRRDLAYATLEGAGEVRAFRRRDEYRWEPWGDAVAVGESPCHVLLAPGGDRIVVTCWGDGKVMQIGLDAAGRPLRAEALAAASDPYAGAAPEPRPSRAHETIVISPTLLATTDIGLDLVRLWRLGGAGLSLEQEVVLPRGVGPRHAVWHPSGHLYVVTEYSCEVYALAPDRTGRWGVVSAAQLLGALPDDSAAELALSRDGEFLYAGVRGSNTIGIVGVRGAGDQLVPVALVEAGVDWPRHHLVVRDTILVAGQLSNEIVSLTVDLRTGVPGKVRHRVEAASPTCLAPIE